VGQPTNQCLSTLVTLSSGRSTTIIRGGNTGQRHSHSRHDRRATSIISPVPTSPTANSRDQPLLGLVGRRGVGKTTLLHQFIHHRIEAGDDPERFLYLPFDADPLYQLQSDEQLRRAVRYYESRILGRIEADHPHFILIDDVHQIEHPNKPTIDGWGRPSRGIAQGRPGTTRRRDCQRRHPGRTGTRKRRDTGRRLRYPANSSRKFRDYLFTLYPDLEEERTR